MCVRFQELQLEARFSTEELFLQGKGYFGPVERCNSKFFTSKFGFHTGDKMSMHAQQIGVSFKAP